MAQDVLLVALGYLIGSIPFGYVIPRLARGEDIRRVGSGNVGASNVFRVYGRGLGVPVALLDVLKGFGPALLGLEAGGVWVGILAGIAAMVGHARPLWLGFSKGGKMVATAGGVTLALAPLAAVVCVGVWGVTFLVTRYASLASIATAVALPVACFVLGEPAPVVAYAGATCVAVLVLHRGNLARLRAGTEPRFHRRRGHTVSDDAG